MPKVTKPKARRPWRPTHFNTATNFCADRFDGKLQMVIELETKDKELAARRCSDIIFAIQKCFNQRAKITRLKNGHKK